jgi:hypothetical protein
MDHERRMEINSDRRERANDRYYDRLVSKENACDVLIGELVNEKGRRFYINTQTKTGKTTGRTREFSQRAEAVLSLMRNNYV